MKKSCGSEYKSFLLLSINCLFSDGEILQADIITDMKQRLIKVNCVLKVIL